MSAGSPMKTGPALHDYDVIIVGAGLPGLALALAIRGSGLSVALVDRKRPSVESSTSIAIVGTTDQWDARVYAISPGNARFLDSIGVWSRMDVERLGPVETMRIFGDAQGAQVDFSAFDAGARALAWIVEQQELMTATLGAWADGPAETLWCESPPQTLVRERDRQCLTLADGTALTAKLVVGADGLQSWTRHQAGIAGEPKPYGHGAIVANFTMAGRHHGRAWQWFQPDGGVMAWLPLAGQRMSIVWSAPAATAADRMSLDDRAFIEAVEAAGAVAMPAVGRLTMLTPRAEFPLSLLRLARPIGERVALVGDAAHGIHPLAGQGLNLGYGDVQALAAALNDRMPIADPGDRLVLSRFASERALPNLAMSMMTDGLWRLFNSPLAGLARNRGMALFNRFPVLKGALMQPAMG